MDYASLLLIGIVVLTVLFFLTACLFLVYCGLFHGVQITTGKPPIGQFTVAYKFGTGPYKNSGDTFTEATCVQPTLKCFGVYYDDPRTVPAEELRWAVGSILAEDDAQPDPAVVQRYTSYDFKIFSFPSTSHSVVTSFPFTSSLSVWLANIRVYPAMANYVEEKQLCAHPWLEIYHSDKIYFMAVLAKQAEFYVPEAGKPNANEDQ